ncbi:MAG: hypothetical protein U0Z44_16815 [Kouleothrix sp.]
MILWSNQSQSPIPISAAAARWSRRPAPAASRWPPPTIESYSDAWRSFAAWAARQGRRTVAEIDAHDLARWIDFTGPQGRWHHANLHPARWRSASFFQ